MNKQKDAVVELVRSLLPNFVPYKDIALILLTKEQLEYIKGTIGAAIIAGDVEYSKGRTNSVEVYAYARSMVMNHLKKTKELNGNQVYGQTPAVVQSKAEDKKLASLNMDVLPEDLKTYVKKLV